MKVYFVTGNEMKAREAKAIMPDVERVSIDLPEIQSLDPKEVLEAKLKVAHQKMPNKILVVEDVTYSIDGLKGLPGTLIKWFIQTIGPGGIYDLVKDKDCRTTVAANLGMIMPSGEMYFVSGEVIGKTVEPDKLSDGIIFDYIFMPDGYNQKYSEMKNELKNSISHRAKAWNELKKHLKQD